METNCLVCPLLVPGSYAVLLYCVLDFSFHHTDDNTAAGFLIQDVSNFSVLLFFFSFFFSTTMTKTVLVSANFALPFFLLSLDFEEHFTKL